MDEIAQLDDKAIAKVSGPAWKPLRESFLAVSNTLLSFSKDARGQLTTIYVKFSTKPSGGAVYAVAWLKSSKQIVVGLALPDGFDSPRLVCAPKGMTYKGLTKYCFVTTEELIPAEFGEWARIAFEAASCG